MKIVAGLSLMFLLLLSACRDLAQYEESAPIMKNPETENNVASVESLGLEIHLELWRNVQPGIVDERAELTASVNASLLLLGDEALVKAMQLAELSLYFGEESWHILPAPVAPSSFVSANSLHLVAYEGPDWPLGSQVQARGLIQLKEQNYRFELSTEISAVQ